MDPCIILQARFHSDAYGYFSDFSVFLNCEASFESVRIIHWKSTRDLKVAASVSLLDLRMIFRAGKCVNQ